jgi:L-fuculose-phosphate aldolase
MAINIDMIHPADQIIMIMERIYGYGMTTTSGGNISVKDCDGNIWITPGRLDKGNLKRHQVVCAAPGGTWIGPHPPSSEFPFHRAVYRARPDLRAVIHAHPPALVSFSLTGRIPDTSILPQTMAVCGEVGYAAYAVPGSGELADNVAAAFGKGHNTVLMENHSIVCGGEDILHAFRRFETLDFCARTHIHASSLGKAVALSREVIQEAPEELPETAQEGRGCAAPPPKETALRRDMCNLIHRAYDQMLFTSTQGTFSARLDEASFLITPYGMDRKYISHEDIVRISGGKREPGKCPSRSVRLHDAIYRGNSAVNAVMIAHPPHVMAYSVTGKTFDTKVMPEAYVFLKEVPVLPFGVQRRNYAETAEVFKEHPVVLIANDCIIVTGGDLVGCFDRLEITEYIAHSLIWAMQIGEIKGLPEKDLKDLRGFWK